MDTDLFTDDVIFLTGGSGFLGTALVCQIITSTQRPRLILLCRGGESRLHQVWQKTLPPRIADMLCRDFRIDVVDGDVCKKNFGLDEATVVQLQSSVNVVIHAASSINLKHNLSRLAPTIIQGTLNTAEFALECTSLERFVYISTAYANAYLHYLNPTAVPFIGERIHPLRNEENLCLDTESEWSYLQEHGTTPQYESTPFPFAYAYAKHLTERLLMNRFQSENDVGNEKEPIVSCVSLSSSSTTSIPEDSSCHKNKTSKLLIVRPSIIGPAETSPAPGWQVATSAPVTGLLTFLILTPAKRLTFYSALPRPAQDALVDEVPVDIVVNRIIVHTALGTSGIVHANRHLSVCHSFGTYARSAQKLRRLPWDSKIVWDKDAKPDTLCEVSKLYQISGCTFEFDDAKTRDVWEGRMGEKQREKFPLFALKAYAMRGSGKRDVLDYSTREKAFRTLTEMHFRRKKWPSWMLPVFYA